MESAMMRMFWRGSFVLLAALGLAAIAHAQSDDDRCAV